MIRDVVGLENYAYVTSDGRVFLKDRHVNNHGTITTLKGKENKGYNNGNGYIQLRFWVDGKTVRKYKHRIVAEAFLPNPNNYTDVNHIDGDKTNNKLSNLEWCTHSDNIKHAITTGLFIPNTSKNPRNYKKCRVCKKLHKNNVYCSYTCRNIGSKINNINDDIYKRQLEDMMRYFKNFTVVSEYYGVSNNTIKKHLKKFNMPYNIEYWKKL